MKRLFVIVFVVLVGLSVVALAMQPRAPKNDTRVHLVWVTDDNPARHDDMRLFEQMNPGVHISIDPSNEGMDKIIVQSEAGVGPDLFDCYSPDQLDAYARAGIAWDVTGPLAQRGIDPRSVVWPLADSTVARGGRVFGFPTNVIVYATWMNTDLFAQSGIPVPHRRDWTWDEFLPLAEKLTKRDPDSGRVTQWGLLLDYWSWSQFVRQWGGNFYSADGTRCTIDSPQVVNGIQFLHDLIYKYKVAPSPAQEDAMATSGGWGLGPIPLFAARRSAMAIGARYWLLILRKDPGMHLAATECPHPAGGLRVYYGATRATLINSQSPNRVAALRFLQFLASRPYNHLIDQAGDGVAAVKKYALQDPAVSVSTGDPSAENITVWRDVLPYGVSAELSPFIDSDAASTIFQKQIDLVLADQKPVGPALHDAAVQVNAAIAQNVSRDPQLRVQYEELTHHARSD